MRYVENGDLIWEFGQQAWEEPRNVRNRWLRRSGAGRQGEAGSVDAQRDGNGDLSG